MPVISARLIFLAIFVACVALMGFGLYLQHAQNLEPCPLCIFQRYAFVLIGAIALLAAVHGPGALGRSIYAALTIVAAGTGAAIAGRQIWLERNPRTAFDCGPDLSYMLDTFPLSQVLPKVFQGEGDCSKVVWRFLGLSIAEWAFVWFALFIAAAVYVVVARRRGRRLYAA
jgi:disulfide bond formation protein DsbB